MTGEPWREIPGTHLDGNPLNNKLSNLAYGTQSENERDKISHGRHRNASKTHCKWGHEFTAENTYTQGNGGRGCRTCRTARDRARRKKQVAA